MLCLPYYWLCFLFNKIRDKGRTDSAWKQREVRGRGRERGIRGRNVPNNVFTCEYMNNFKKEIPLSFKGTHTLKMKGETKINFMSTYTRKYQR
jgi:hypothetical protein